MSQVPIRTTRLTPTAAERILRKTGLRPSALRLLMALWDLETETGAKMFNHNWGNMVIGSDKDHPFYVADDSGNLRKFRAYDDVFEGAADWIRQLFRSDKPWGEGIASGDPVVFAQRLKDGGYYEAPVERYTKTLVGRWQRYPHLRDVKTRRATPTPAHRGQTSGGALAAVLLLAGIGVVAWAWS